MDLESLVGHEHTIGELVLERPSPGRHAARQAIAHVQKAERLCGIDPEMALFRSITGQEEAARAIFHSLQRLQYPHARRLDWHSHKQKAAVVPFMAAMGKLLEQIGWGRAEVILGEIAGKRALQVRFTLIGPNRNEPMSFVCDPPLNVRLTIEGRPHWLREEVAAVASESNFESMEKFVGFLAEERNYLLYASEGGIPTVSQPVEPILRERRQNVFGMLVLFLLIDPHRQRQPLVAQALQSFLAMVKRLPEPTS